MKFGTSGIRGIYGKDITEKKVMDFVSTLSGGTMVVGNDARPQSISLKHSAISSHLRKGDVVDIGMVPTGVLGFITRAAGDLGIQFTASHNPPEYAGLKVFSRFGRNISEDSLPKGGGGRPGSYFSLDPRPMYYKAARKFLKIFHPSCSFLLDPGNGSGSNFFDRLLISEGFDFEKINSVPNAIRPSRPLEPKPDTLKESIKALKHYGLDMGIAFDGDADRVVFFDREGFLGFNEMIAIISKEYIERTNASRKVVTTIEAGLIFEKILEGYKVTRTRVGDINVAKLMPEHGVVGVEQPGHYIFHDFYPAPDVFLPMIIALSIGPEKIREEIDKVERTHFIKISVPSDDKHSAVSRFKERIDEFGPKEVRDDDGIFLKGDDWILLVRASGTEDVVRISADSHSESLSRELVERARRIVEGVE